MRRMLAADSIDEYIARYPRDVQARLKKMRGTIARAAPDAGEAIKYGIPTFTMSGHLVYFGAFKHHISFFPTSSPIREFKEELAGYVVSKGTVQFPHDKPIPYALVKRIVKFRVQESHARAAAKTRKR